MAAYLLDANTLISAHRQYDPFDLFPLRPALPD